MKLKGLVSRTPWLRSGAWSVCGLLAGVALGIPAGRATELILGMMLVLPALLVVMERWHILRFKAPAEEGSDSMITEPPAPLTNR